VTTPHATDPWAPPPPRAPWRTSRRWFAIVGAVWLLVVGLSAWWGLTHADPTDRDQTTVAEARPVVDEAIARVAATVTADGTGVVAVSSFERMASCEISVVRDGERYRRGLVAVVPPGSEAELLARVADALPDAYRAGVRRGGEPRLNADAGFWVQLTGSVSGPGEVRFLADTGDCRPAGDVDAADPTPSVPADAVAEVLSRLDQGTGTRTSASVSCVDGGQLGTVEVRVDPYPGDLDVALADLEPTTVVVQSPRLYAYRSGNTQVAVRAHDDVTIITATTGCGS